MLVIRSTSMVKFKLMLVIILKKRQLKFPLLFIQVNCYWTCFLTINNYKSKQNMQSNYFQSHLSFIEILSRKYKVIIYLLLFSSLSKIGWLYLCGSVFKLSILLHLSILFVIPLYIQGERERHRRAGEVHIR